MENMTKEQLQEIIEKQHKAIADIKSLVFLNTNIPDKERQRILNIVESVIRL